jgi:hypothetical protein
VRNGSVMQDQRANYNTSPYFLNNRDLDLHLCQIAASALPGNVVVGLILHRYSVINFVFPRKNTRLPFATDHLQNMLEESLILLCWTLTELQLNPSDDPDYYFRTRLRREFIHKLAAGPVSFADLQVCSNHLSDHSSISSQLIGEIVHQVSESRETVLIDSPKRTLRAQCWAEYDPTFYHMVHHGHQKAVDIRPPVNAPAAMVAKPSPVHPLFADVRLKICTSELFLQMLRSIIVIFAGGIVEKADTRYDSIRALPVRMNSKIFSVAVQLLTLTIYAVEERNAVPGADRMEEDNGNSNVAGASWYSFLLQSQPLTLGDSDTWDDTDTASRASSMENTPRDSVDGNATREMCFICGKSFGLFRLVM